MSPASGCSVNKTPTVGWALLSLSCLCLIHQKVTMSLHCHACHHFQLLPLLPTLYKSLPCFAWIIEKNLSGSPCFSQERGHCDPGSQGHSLSRLCSPPHFLCPSSMACVIFLPGHGSRSLHMWYLPLHNPLLICTSVFSRTFIPA